MINYNSQRNNFLSFKLHKDIATHACTRRISTFSPICSLFATLRTLFERSDI